MALLAEDLIQELTGVRRRRSDVSDELAIAIQGRDVIVNSSAGVYRMRIPEGGFGFNELFSFSTLLNVHSSWLAKELSRPEFDGIAGEYVAELATEESRVIDDPTRAIAHMIHQTVGRPELNVLTEPVPDDEVCVVCQLTKAAAPNKSWATAEGCDVHRFHYECIQRWRGTRCMVCNVELFD